LGGIGGIFLFIFSFNLTFAGGVGKENSFLFLMLANIGVVLVFAAFIINKRFRHK
jgi:hypothetical protein